MISKKIDKQTFKSEPQWLVKSEFLGMSRFGRMY